MIKMTKQEHIEEMINAMAASNNPFVDVPIEIMPKVAEVLYNAGYRKLSKDSVVLSKEEYDTLKAKNDKYVKDCIDYIATISKLENKVWEVEQQARKETAAKLIKLIEFHSISKRDKSGYETFTISNLCLREILREEFGFTSEELETIYMNY